jgi:hypothetical protein
MYVNTKYNFKFYGNYKNGKKDGTGVSIFDCGKELYCNYKNGCSDGYCTIKYTNGNILSYFRYNKKTLGYGCMKYANGNKFIGKFDKDEINGDGLYYDVETNSTYFANKIESLPMLKLTYWTDSDLTHFMFNKTIKSESHNFVNFTQDCYKEFIKLCLQNNVNKNEIMCTYKNKVLPLETIAMFYNNIECV